MEVERISRAIETALGPSGDDQWHLDQEEMKRGFRAGASALNPQHELPDTIRLYQRLRNRTESIPSHTRELIAERWLPNMASAERPMSAAYIASEYGLPHPKSVGRLMVMDIVLKSIQEKSLSYSLLISRHRAEEEGRAPPRVGGIVVDPLSRSSDWRDIRYLALLNHRADLIRERRKELLFPTDMERKQMTPRWVRHVIREELAKQVEAGITYGKWTQVAKGATERLGVEIGVEQAKKIMAAASEVRVTPRSREPRSHVYTSGENKKLLFLALDPEMQESQSNSVGLGLLRLREMARAFNQWRSSLDPEHRESAPGALRNQLRRKLAGDSIGEMLREPVEIRREVAEEQRAKRAEMKSRASAAAVAAGYELDGLEPSKRRGIFSGLSAVLQTGNTPFTKEEISFLRAIHDDGLCRHPKGGLAKPGTVNWQDAAEKISTVSPLGVERCADSLRRKYHRIFGRKSSENTRS